jgi:uncharacterized protein YjiK
MKFSKLFVVFAVACMATISCSRGNDGTQPTPSPAAGVNPAQATTTGMMPGYALDTPDQTHVLPDILMEASGVTDVSSTEVAIVQDELGEIFRYDIDTGEILQRIPFGPPGDYEGITRVNNAMYVLQSNGNLFTIQDWLGTAKASQHRLPLSTADNEGLAFDPVEQSLLVSPKSRWKKGKSGKVERPIFSVDIASGQLSAEPFLVLNTNDLIDFANAHGLDIPRKITKKGEEKIDLAFKPASVAVHPVTHDIFVISAAGNALASFNRKGEVTGLQFLNRERFPKAEGITFLPDASLVIVNEAAGAKPTLQVFKWDNSALAAR